MYLNDNYKYAVKKFSKKEKMIVAKHVFIAFMITASLVLLNYSSFHDFHITVELFASIISFCILIVAVNTYQISENDFFMFLGIGLMCAGSLDLIHTFSYSDMNILRNVNFNTPAQFWVAARAIELITILVSTIFINKRIKKSNYYMIAAAYIAYFAFVILAILKYNIFPVFRIEGQGLTAIKIFTEYALSAGFLISFIIFFKERKYMDKMLSIYIAISLLLKIPQGICFTLYADNTDFAFFFGHILKIISYYFMYKAIIVNGLQRPLDMFITDLDNADIQKRLLEEAILRNDECYDLTINHSDDGIVILRDDKIIFANSTAASLIGAKDTFEIIGKEPYNFMDDELASKMKIKYKRMLNDKNKLPFEELRLLRLDGIETYMECSSNYFIFRGIPAILTILRDMGPQKEINSLKNNIMESEKRLSQSQEYNKFLTEFFSNISHELKTPLAIILGTIQLVSVLRKEEQCGIEKDKLNSYIGTMKQNTYRLIRLVNNLIDTSKYDSGHLNLKLRNYNIVSVVENICQSVNEFVNSKGIRMSFDTNEEEKVMAVDADQIERIVLNLLSNAVKFTDKGGEILVYFEDMVDFVRISVKDTGIGIPEDKQKIIFDRFGQVDRTFTRNREGSGIGLSMVKTLVELHGGSISVKSKIGEGSEFIVELPVKIIEEEEDDFSLEFENKVDKINIEFSDIYTSE